MRQKWRWFIDGCCALTLLNACGSPPPPRTATPEAPPAYSGKLTDLVASAGLRWLVAAEPKRLWSNPKVARGLGRLFPKERLDAFAQGSGVDLRTLPTAVVAGFDLGTLYLARASERVGIAEHAFLERLISDPLVKHLGKGVTHTTGLIGNTPESFLALEGYGLALSVGDPTLTKIAGAFALGKLHKSPSVFTGAALRELPQKLESEPLRFYAPGPFTGKWAQGAEGLLEYTTAVAIVATPLENGGLRVAVTALGDYGSDVAGTNRKARDTLNALATSDLGRVLGFADASVIPVIVADNTNISLTMTLPLERLMDGLYTAVAANVWEMLELGPKRQSTL